MWKHHLELELSELDVGTRAKDGSWGAACQCLAPELFPSICCCWDMRQTIRLNRHLV